MASSLDPKNRALEHLRRRLGTLCAPCTTGSIKSQPDTKKLFRSDASCSTQTSVLNFKLAYSFPGSRVLTNICRALAASLARRRRLHCFHSLADAHQPLSMCFEHVKRTTKRGCMFHTISKSGRVLRLRLIFTLVVTERNSLATTHTRDRTTQHLAIVSKRRQALCGDLYFRVGTFQYFRML